MPLNYNQVERNLCTLNIKHLTYKNILCNLNPRFAHRLLVCVFTFAVAVVDECACDHGVALSKFADRVRIPRTFRKLFARPSYARQLIQTSIHIHIQSKEVCGEASERCGCISWCYDASERKCIARETEERARQTH